MTATRTRAAFGGALAFATLCFANPARAQQMGNVSAPPVVNQTLFVGLINDTIDTFTTASGVGIPYHTTIQSGGLHFPTGLAFDSAGNLYVANSGPAQLHPLNSIEEFNATTGVGTQFASGLNYPEGLAFDNAGNLYVANGGNGTIEKFNSAGMGMLFASGVSGVQGLAVDSAGNLYAADNGNIEKFNTTTGMGTLFASNANSTAGLAFDSAGNLYVLNNSEGIEKFDSAGVGTPFYVSGSLDTPQGLAVDNSGNVYVANYGGGDPIEVFNPAGVGTQFATTGGHAPLYLAFAPTPAPEPSEWVSLGIGALGLCGLALRARRRAMPGV